MRNQTLIRILLAAVVLAAVPIVLAIGNGAAARAGEATANARPTTTASAASLLPALSRPAATTDTMDPATKAMLGSPATNDVRSITTPTGTGWAIATPTGACLAVPDPVDGYGYTCASSQEVATGHLSGVLTNPDSRTSTVVAVVPVGSTATAVTGRRRKALPLINGVLAIRTSDIDRVELATPNAAQITPLDTRPVAAP